MAHTSDPLPAKADVVVVGAGVVGLATAMALSGAGLRVSVIEAEGRVAAHQTSHNSGVIHSGLYYKPGSLKAKLCVEGRSALLEFCAAHNIPHEICGKVVIACDEAEKIRLEELIRRGTANGLSGLTMLTPEQVRGREPNVACVAGVVVADEGIIDYGSVARAYANVIRSRGSSVSTNAGLVRVTRAANRIVAHSSRGDVEARMLVNCAGLQCDRVARLCGLVPEIRIVPFRGEYYELTDEARSLVRHLIYPVPDPRFPFLGVHFTRMIDGKVEAGPNAVLAFARHGYRLGDVSPRDLMETLAFAGFWRMAGRYWKPGMGEMWRSVSKGAFLRALRRLMPGLRSDQIRRAGAGVRAQALTREGLLADDFVIQQAPQMVHVLNAPSPAATASIAIGREIARRVCGQMEAPMPGVPLQHTR